MHQATLDLEAGATAGIGTVCKPPRPERGNGTARLAPPGPSPLLTPYCPVIRQPLGGSGASAAVPMRLNAERAATPDNLVIASRIAAAARAGLTAAQILQQVERMQRADQAAVSGLDADAWSRLASLSSLATPMPHLQAVRVPMRALPPVQAHLCNPVQALQAALTQGLRLPGWSRRAAAIADALPQASLRHDFNLFVGALAARLMEIALDGDEIELQWAMEDAWADSRLQRRWAQFAVQLDATQCRALLARVQRGCRQTMQPRRHESSCLAGSVELALAQRRLPLQRATRASTSMRPQTSLPTSQRLATLPSANNSLPSSCWSPSR